MALQFLGSDGERRPPASDDEGFGVGMLVQPWPHAGRRRRLQDDRDVGIALVALRSPRSSPRRRSDRRTINHEPVHRANLTELHRPKATPQADGITEDPPGYQKDHED